MKITLRHIFPITHAGIFIGVLLLSPCITGTGWAATLSLNSVQGKNGDMVTFELSVSNAPNTVQAFTVDVVYDFTTLSYRSFTDGVLAGDGYALFSVSNQSPGVVRIGGIEPEYPGITRGSSGSLVYLTFEVIGDQDAILRLSRLKSDMQNWSTQNGKFSFIAGMSEDALNKEADKKNGIVDQGSTTFESAENPSLIVGKSADFFATGGADEKDNPDSLSSVQGNNVAAGQLAKSENFYPDLLSRLQKRFGSMSGGGLPGRSHVETVSEESPLDKTASKLHGKRKSSLKQPLRQTGFAKDKKQPELKNKSLTSSKTAVENGSGSPGAGKAGLLLHTVGLFLQAAILFLLIAILREIRALRKEGRGFVDQKVNPVASGPATAPIRSPEKTKIIKLINQ